MVSSGTAATSAARRGRAVRGEAEPVDEAEDVVAAALAPPLRTHGRSEPSDGSAAPIVITTAARRCHDKVRDCTRRSVGDAWPPVRSAAMASVPAGSVRALRADRRHRRPARHAGGDGDVRPRRQRRRRGDRRQRRDGRRPRRTCVAWAATCSPSCTRRTARSSASTPADAPAAAPTPQRMRAEGLTEMPLRHDIRAVTVPGLRRRLGRPARALRPASTWPTCWPRRSGSPRPASRPARCSSPRSACSTTWPRPRFRARRAGDGAGARVRRPGVALALHAIADGGRDGVLRRRVRRGAARPRRRSSSPRPTSPARRPTGSTPLAVDAFGVDLQTIAPNSQGYLAARRRPAGRAGRPARRPRRPGWAHLLVEAAAAAGFDRPDVLHERADGAALLAAIEERVGLVDAEQRRRPAGRRRAAATPRTCAPPTRGIGRQPDPVQRRRVRLVAGRAEHRHQPAQPRARLQPAPRPSRRVRPGPAAAAHAAAGDGHPRRRAGRGVRHDGWRRPAADPAAAGGAPVPPRQRPADAVAAPRWALRGARSPGSTRGPAACPPSSSVEGHAPTGVANGLPSAATASTSAPPSTAAFGHAHVIAVDADGASPPPPTPAPASAAPPAADLILDVGCRDTVVQERGRRSGGVRSGDLTPNRWQPQRTSGRTSSTKRAICSSAFL